MMEHRISTRVVCYICPMVPCRKPILQLALLWGPKRWTSKLNSTSAMTFLGNVLSWWADNRVSGHAFDLNDEHSPTLHEATRKGLAECLKRTDRVYDALHTPRPTNAICLVSWVSRAMDRIWLGCRLASPKKSSGLRVGPRYRRDGQHQHAHWRSSARCVGRDNKNEHDIQNRTANKAAHA